MSHRTVFHDFVEDFCGLERGSFLGLQASYGFNTEGDLLLFNTKNRNTIAVPVSTLLEPQEVARQIIQQKIAASQQAWKKASEQSSGGHHAAA